eukprot:TRINITY_DN381_c0_g1_i1.p1 TRINITY_DN381_c0_g1~~TRINITY_DN381_c0_g1_i1.p1  ORF type:complete len:207 (+),score=58.64 TRINITY_DN381_c0_g1_i1:200-820(+)
MQPGGKKRDKEASGKASKETVVASNETVAVKETRIVVKKERKTFDLPGQKFDKPEERDGAHVFYESLHQQRPDSAMAQIWLMEHGCLDFDEAQEVFDQVKGKKLGTAGGTPTKGVRNGAGQQSAPSRPLALPPPKTTANGQSAKKVVKSEAANGSKSAGGSAKGKGGEGAGKSSAPKVRRKKVEYDDDDDEDDEDQEIVPTKKVRR